jgi:hypothetical protein
MMAAYCVDASPAVGQPGDVHSTQSNDLGAVRKFSDGNSYIYLKGVTSCADGSMVVFQPGVWTAILIATGVKGDVAIATGAVDAATKYGWFIYIGQDVAIARSAIASNVPLYAGGVSGSPDDVAVKGDQIMNAFARNASAGGGDSAIIQLNRAFIGMSNESVG